MNFPGNKYEYITILRILVCVCVCVCVCMCVCVCVCVISQYFRGLIPNSEIKTADITSGYQKPQKYIQPLHSSVNWKKTILYGNINVN